MSTNVTGRTMPHNLEAEKALLGAILTYDHALVDVAGLITAPEFYRDAHQRIFKTAQALSANGVAVDLVTVKEALTVSGELNRVGGPVYLAGVTEGVPRSSNVAYYAEIIHQKARLRALIQAGTKLVAEAYEAGDDDAASVLDRAEQALFELSFGRSTGGFKRLGALIPNVMEQIEVWNQTKQGISGVPSGLTDLDDMTRGFQAGNLIVIGARPAMGKTALMLNIAQHVAKQGKTVGVFSLEMSETELVVRTITAEARIDGHRLQRGWAHENDWGRLAAAIGILGGLPLFIDESPFIGAFEMRSKARKLKAQEGLDLLIVDYTQLMLAQDSARKENRTLELAAITRALKGLAKDLKVPVIALSQLSRKVEERHDKRPMLSDLRESGSLEQDADLVIFIHREPAHKDTDQDRGTAELIIAKHRNGPIGTVKVAWNPQFTQFTNRLTAIND